MDEWVGIEFELVCMWVTWNIA